MSLETDSGLSEFHQAAPRATVTLLNFFLSTDIAYLLAAVLLVNGNL